MKKKVFSVLILINLIYITILILYNANLVINTIHLGIDIWIKNVFPALFTFFVLSELLINYGFLEFFGELTKNIMVNFFRLPKEAAFVIFGSMISGFPSASKYTKKLLTQQQINTNQANYLLTFTHFSNPLFILGTIGTKLLKNSYIGIIILLSHILSNFILVFFFRPKIKHHQKEKVSLKKALAKAHYKRISNTNSFANTLSNSIIDSINTLLLLLGIIITYLILTTLISKTFYSNDYIDAIISGFLEMTSGVNKVSLLNLSLKIKASLITLFISFGGLSVHTQVASINSDTNIRYKYFFIARLFHMIISSSIVFLIMNFTGF